MKKPVKAKARPSPKPKAAALDGVLVAGKGKAGPFIAMHEYGKFMAMYLGLRPYPGTLNVKVDARAKGQFISGKVRLRLDEFKWQGKVMGGISAYPVIVQGRVPALLVAPDRTTHPANIAEIVAVANLRRGLKLKNGSKVAIK